MRLSLKLNMRVFLVNSQLSLGSDGYGLAIFCIGCTSLMHNVIKVGLFKKALFIIASLNKVGRNTLGSSPESQRCLMYTSHVTGCRGSHFV